MLSFPDLHQLVACVMAALMTKYVSGSESERLYLGIPGLLGRGVRVRRAVSRESRRLVCCVLEVTAPLCTLLDGTYIDVK